MRLGSMTTGLVLGLLTAGAAQARVEIRSEALDRREACFLKVYVPAKVEYNSRGKLVRPERRDWERAGGARDADGIEVGTLYNRVRRPAIYIETRRVIEKDHYLLRRIPCA